MLLGSVGWGVDGRFGLGRRAVTSVSELMATTFSAPVTGAVPITPTMSLRLMSASVLALPSEFVSATVIRALRTSKVRTLPLYLLSPVPPAVSTLARIELVFLLIETTLAWKPTARVGAVAAPAVAGTASRAVRPRMAGRRRGERMGFLSGRDGPVRIGASCPPLERGFRGGRRADATTSPAQLAVELLDPAHVGGEAERLHAVSGAILGRGRPRAVAERGLAESEPGVLALDPERHLGGHAELVERELQDLIRRIRRIRRLHGRVELAVDERERAIAAHRPAGRARQVRAVVDDLREALTIGDRLAVERARARPLAVEHEPVPGDEAGERLCERRRARQRTVSAELGSRSSGRQHERAGENAGEQHLLHTWTP